MSKLKNQILTTDSVQWTTTGFALSRNTFRAIMSQVHFASCNVILYNAFGMFHTRGLMYAEESPKEQALPSLQVF